MNTESLQQLQQLKDEIHQTMREALNNSNLGEVFNNYGISGHQIFKVQCMLDLTEVEFNDAEENQRSGKFLQAIPEQEIKFAPLGWCATCDVNGCECQRGNC